ncbi:DUF4097 family beta strand repeat-containing protein [Streptomyces sp. NBC_01304]|uniref:DUF4097 family beta strand repeat-containing protein n=1 Tax=Streptomyces sp. NBC_01304 TaxID=2903818 RepID=UPI002E0DA083|nr:DUF4097 domain-containing protein [Streptomyces sp. NBC_01304]
MNVRTLHTARRARTLLVTGAVAAAVVLVGGCGADAGDDTDPETREFAVRGKALSIDSDDSALDVVAADVERVRVTRWFDGETVLGEDPGVTWRLVDGNRLELRVNCDGMLSDCSARHRIEVPRAMTVDVLSRDGRVNASGFDTALKVRSHDGRVVVEESGGALDIDSKDGSVEAVGVESKDVKVRSQDGRVHLELAAVPDRVDVESNDGSIEIALPDATYEVAADSNDSAVDVTVPRGKDSAHRVAAHSHDGKVTVRPVSAN